MSTFPRTLNGFAMAHRAAVMYIDLHDRDIFLYVPPAGDCYELSIIAPRGAVADGTSVTKYNRERVGADEINRVMEDIRQMGSTYLFEGDSWEAQMDLADRWAEAGGTSNIRVAKPFKVQAEAMEQRLKAAGVPHPLDTRAAELADGVAEGQPV